MTPATRRLAAWTFGIVLACAGSIGRADVGSDETAVTEALVHYAQGHFAEAARGFEPAARQGNPAAQYHMGLLYARGEGVAQDYAIAASWFLQAAEQDHNHAQFILGHMYARGEGVVRDRVQAHVWFSAATANGWWKAREARERLVDEGMSPQEVAQAGKRYRAWRQTREVGQ